MNRGKRNNDSLLNCICVFTLKGELTILSIYLLSIFAFSIIYYFNYSIIFYLSEFYMTPVILIGLAQR